MILGFQRNPGGAPKIGVLLVFVLLGTLCMVRRQKACKRVWGDTLPSLKPLQPWRSEEEGSFFFNGARAVLQLSK